MRLPEAPEVWQTQFCPWEKGPGRYIAETLRAPPCAIVASAHDRNGVAEPCDASIDPRSYVAQLDLSDIKAKNQR